LKSEKKGYYRPDANIFKKCKHYSVSKRLRTAACRRMADRHMPSGPPPHRTLYYYYIISFRLFSSSFSAGSTVAIIATGPRCSRNTDKSKRVVQNIWQYKYKIIWYYRCRFLIRSRYNNNNNNIRRSGGRWQREIAAHARKQMTRRWRRMSCGWIRQQYRK